MILYDWGQGRQLTAVNNRISGVIEQYRYNADGLRSRKITYQNGVSATTEYVWGNNGLAGFTNGEDTVTLLYGTDGTAVGFTLNDDVYTYLKNL